MKLKTLKDIELEPCEGCGLNIGFDVVPMVRTDTLRKEAIKWIKSKHCMNFTTAFDSDLFSNADEAMGAVKMLKHFFLITEEDLKWKEN